MNMKFNIFQNAYLTYKYNTFKLFNIELTIETEVNSEVH